MIRMVDKTQWYLLRKLSGCLRRARPAAPVVFLAGMILFSGAGPAQMRTGADSDSRAHPTVQPGQDTATIGTSGYKVPIPEIKMRSIVGDQPRKTSPPARLKEEVRDGEEAPNVRGPAEITPPPTVPRLPFDRVERKPMRGPRKGPTKVPPAIPEEPAPPAPEPDLPALPPAEEVTEALQPSVPPTRSPSRGPVQPESPLPETPPPTETPTQAPAAPPTEVEPEPTEPAPEKTELPAPAKEEGTHKESQIEPIAAPPAPEDAVKPPPPPKKEILNQKALSLPALMKARRSREARKSMTLDSAVSDDMADPRGWVQFEERRDPELIPLPEPEPEPEPAPETPSPSEVLPAQEPQALPEAQPVPEPTPPQPETLPQPEPEPAPLPEPQPKVEPEPKPAPQPEPQPIVQPEPKPTAPPAPPPSTSTVPEPMPVPEPGPLDSGAKESLPPETGVEPPGEKETLPPIPEPPPDRILFPSPLRDDVLESWEVKEYLRKTAPILEELSLLMARAPSLTIADYDPSDPNAPAVPRDVHPKMDSMKRTLQILDSKAFEIIPPRKYLPFHGLIRESIAETYKACDAITEYLDSNKPEDLQGVHDHLLRARELIRQTREVPQRG